MSVITDPNYPGYVYVGGPRAGLTVLFETGWPPPAEIENIDWPLGRYVLERASKRYVWHAGPDRRRPTPMPS